jgi:accessory colonization factor AcfC
MHGLGMLHTCPAVPLHRAAVSPCFCLAVCETTVALVVRKGNPKNVRTWEDLLQPGLQVG